LRTNSGPIGNAPAAHIAPGLSKSSPLQNERAQAMPGEGLSPRELRPLRLRCLGLYPSRRGESSDCSELLGRIGSREITVLLTHSTVRAFSGTAAYYALC